MRFYVVKRYRKEKKKKLAWELHIHKDSNIVTRCAAAKPVHTPETDALRGMAGSAPCDRLQARMSIALY